MSAIFSEKTYFNLVRFELENYIVNIEMTPDTKNEIHYSSLRTKMASIHRAIHWYLLKNKLVYQNKVLINSKTKNFKYENQWQLKKFNRENICKSIIKNYQDYFTNLTELNPIYPRINDSLEAFLIKKGKEKKLSIKFNELKKIYYDSKELIITEFNKYLIENYVPFFNKHNN